MRYIYIKAETQSEGDLHLSDGTNWAASTALIKTIRVVTSSTDWDLYLLQNDNGYAADDGNIPKMQIVEAGNGDLDIYLDHPYKDEDNSAEVHLYYIDNEAANTADIYIIGLALDELATATALASHDTDLGTHDTTIVAGIATIIDDIATHDTGLTTHHNLIMDGVATAIADVGILAALPPHGSAMRGTNLAALATSFTFTAGNVHAVGMAPGVLQTSHWPNQ